MTDVKQRTVSVSYRRQVSDGNYGTEAAEVSLQWFIDEDNDSDTDLQFASEMIASARDVVLTQLRASLSQAVRKAVTRSHQPPQGSIAPARTAATVPTDGEDLPF